ncbi:hypothetical protein [Nocardia sp. NPDC049707]|uniref:hypothetical protein n=1 Tax=Nocardia sp. NPDC049707 TaxID=3154735 RepID=UPI00342577C8
MSRHTLLRPEGLVKSDAFSHVAIVPPGATTVYMSVGRMPSTPLAGSWAAMMWPPRPVR